MIESQTDWILTPDKTLPGYEMYVEALMCYSPANWAAYVGRVPLKSRYRVVIQQKGVPDRTFCTKLQPLEDVRSILHAMLTIERPQKVPYPGDKFWGKAISAMWLDEVDDIDGRGGKLMDALVAVPVRKKMKEWL